MQKNMIGRYIHVLQDSALSMRQRLQKEWVSFVAVVRSLDRQTVFVLVVCVALMFVQLTVGSRKVFRREYAELFSVEWQGLMEWGWWFGWQGITGFVLPVFFLLVLFKRKPSEIGLGLGDWKLALLLAGIYMPLVVFGTWVLSNGADFQAQYPHLKSAVTDWRFFLVYETLFLFYWMGWEYLWRGFVLFGTAPTFGVYAIFVQMIPFALLHADKPLIEAFLSILGGLALGALVWRCRSFWIAVPLHAFQMIMIDLWCTLRMRSGVDGVGLGALWELLIGHW